MQKFAETPLYITSKFGIQTENVLPYVRVGYAVASYQILIQSTVDDRIRDRRNRLMVGGGFDVLFTPRFISGVSYDLLQNNHMKTFSYAPVAGAQLEIKHNHHQILLKLAYKV